jgi:nitrous oxide reductase accessory protein NosL
MVHLSKTSDSHTRRPITAVDRAFGMDGPTTPVDRRRLLALIGASSAVALAGCAGGGDDGDGSSPTDTPTPSDVVPEEYRTAASLNDRQRDPDALSAKSDVNYQSEPDGGQQCSGCAYYIPDRNGDGVGACSIVEGNIEPSGYCVSYAAYDEGTSTDGDSTGDGEASLAPVDVPEDAECAVCGMTVANFPEWNAQTVHEDDTREFFCTAGCATTYYAVTDQFADTDAAIAGLWVRDFDSRELVDGTGASYALETDSDRVDDPMRLNPAPFATREDAVAYVEAVAHLTVEDIVELSAFDRDLAEQYRGRLIE